MNKILPIIFAMLFSASSFAQQAIGVSVEEDSPSYANTKIMAMSTLSGMCKMRGKVMDPFSIVELAVTCYVGVTRTNGIYYINSARENGEICKELEGRDDVQVIIHLGAKCN
jgi:hypothetical protein